MSGRRTGASASAPKVATFYDAEGEILTQVLLLKGNESLALPPGAVRMGVSTPEFVPVWNEPGLQMAKMEGRWLSAGEGKHQ